MATRRGGSGQTAAARRRGGTGRYTPPIPREVRKSPRWHGALILTLLIGAAIVIVLNYVSVLPASPTTWYTIGSIVAILVGGILATNFR